MQTRSTRRRFLAALSSVPPALGLVGLGGCGREASSPVPPGPGQVAGNDKVRIGYLGLTCEAAMVAAFENGFFREEALDVEFVKTDWDSLRDGLGLGRFDANYHLIMYLLKPIEKGLDVKITGGIHSGCLRLQAGVKSSIRSVADVKGKKIGVPTALGSPPFLFSSRVLRAAGMDPAKDVEWVAMAPDVLGLALDNGQVEAVCTADPIGSILLSQKKVHTIADSAVDAPYKDEYCCAVVVSGKLARERPAAAAKVTRALLKGAAWVEANPTAAARLAVEKKYVASSLEVNAHALSQLKYTPGVSRCRESVMMASREMQAIGLISPSTSPETLASTAWLDLDGVNDEWLKGVKVEKVAGGGPPPPLDAERLVSLYAGATDLRLSCDDCGSMLADDLCRRPAGLP
ncbi:ABC transporter substrate-binding protein [Aquisphaera insulae]|uniref:ABC transporter substrate-binding protein n=1 Tax=Aquisphaera insulae TaxID=2712864 RepID=UPI0013EA4105|nr:ABC transporter substrate-binding protein [Aquisphaera insulae]